MYNEVKIPLSRNAITKSDFLALSEWLKTEPKITQGELTKKFEKEFAKWLGIKYAIFCNSGSSANLLALEAYRFQTNKNRIKAVVSSLSWSTTVSPLMRLKEYIPILCDACKDTLSIDPFVFDNICYYERPDILFLVPVLGIMPKMNEILSICNKYNVDLLIDSCETLGSSIKGLNIAQYGIMSTFSTFMGHILVSGEGGFITTNNKELYNILKSIRSHGWVRDWSIEDKNKILNENKIDHFDSQYTFFYPGYNLRSMEFNAFLGLRNIKKLNINCRRRKEILQLYDKLINNGYWKVKITNEDVGFAYPIISKNKINIVKNLINNGVECRPLIAGSIFNQPMWKKYGNKIVREDTLSFSSLIHKYGFYVPINENMLDSEVEFICEIINETIK